MPVRSDLFRAAHESVTHPRLTEGMVGRAERKLGVKLPAAYLEALRLMNGGYLRYNCFIHKKKPIGVDTLIGIGKRDDDSLENGLLDNQYYLDEWGIPGGLILLDGDGHTWVALDYRKCGPTGEPPVVYVNTEGDCVSVRRLARDFQSFVDRLVDGEYRRIYGFTDSARKGDVLRDALASALGIRWEPFGTEGVLQGVRKEWKGTLRQVVKGAHFLFMPHDDPEEGLRFPEHSECKWLLYCDVQSRFRGRLDAALRDAGLGAVRLHEPHYEFEV